ncbi:MAG TPA: polysaccharide deacetylase family protein [Actinospica sp.]|jgi:peptidoglycan/xylan/chitin deacetylase (PgdA/CDA1 family)|nr:polysaccharide deacetylase family protein [Actinospica sp.]
MTEIEPAQWTRRGFGRILGGAAGLATLGSFAAACSNGGGTTTAGDVAASGSAVAAGDSASAGPGASTGSGGGVDADLLMQRYGLHPFAAAPAAPATKAITLDPQDPTIFAKVPTSDKICFVTIDDGIDKDPAFIQMVKDFQIPITCSLADTLIRDDYAYFEKLYETGYMSIQNHTVNHPLSMPSLGYQEQLDEIAGQQTKLHKEYGVTPYIFRPPGGNYNSVTREACRGAGLKGMMLWKEAMEIEDMEYQTSDRHLQPGDIILCHFRGPAQLKGETMVQMMTHLYSHIQAQGFTVADVTKYV